MTAVLKYYVYIYIHTYRDFLCNRMMKWDPVLSPLLIFIRIFVENTFWKYEQCTNVLGSGASVQRECSFAEILQLTVFFNIDTFYYKNNLLLLSSNIEFLG